ncbi:MAG: hypothetical protein GWN07_08330 [Actinobacteria bacterium]|nr:hypothetical protein [Actinomycetota bacterium]NIU65488.1 hypothetical protein [Actinomycetota bacterium]NIW27297.1 hypothetical protein [Actinomycetota bacterium]NIX19832.1 hypothetical protein [Actinomycetota bacterium]
MRRLLAAIAVLLFATPALADLESETGRTKGTILFKTLMTSFNCTDSYDTPATTNTTSPLTLANLDTFPEALDFLANLNDAVQTSGSPDGWCDAKPYVTRTEWTPSGTETAFYGPIPVAADGIRHSWDFGSNPTNYEIAWGIADPADPTAFLPVWDTGVLTDFNVTTYNFGPLVHTAYSTRDWHSLIPVGELYIRVTFTGGTLVDFHTALIPYNSRAYGDDR